MELTIKKKLAGLVAAGALALAVAPMAAFGVGELTADTTLSVAGLDQGDQVSFYQIIEQAGPEDGNGWKFVDELDANADGTLDGTAITIDDLRAAANAEDYDDFEVITGDMANEIAAAVAAANLAASYDETAGEGGTIVVDLRAGLEDEDPTPVGMYMAIVTQPAEIGVVYKPVFVSADYDQGDAHGSVGVHDNTNEITIVMDETDYQDEPSIFKKSELNLVKVAGDENDRLMDLGVGDVVEFTITTNLVTYTQNFESPVFKITDVLTDGLILTNAAGEAIEPTDVIVEVEGYEIDEYDYTVTINSEKQFTVEFLNDDTSVDGEKDGILFEPLGNPEVTITYHAMVTSADENITAQVTQMDNNVRLDFTNAPDDTTGAGTLKDRTRHYTFSIDANIMGPSTGPDGETVTSEIRKIAVDANGEPIYETLTSATKETVEEEDPDVYNWLEGATFQLVMTHKFVDADDADYGDNGTMQQLDAPVVITFDDNFVAGGDNDPVSDANGYIPMKGLDAGVYELTETSAPLGYSFDPSMKYIITIEPFFVDDDEADPLFKDAPNKILSGYDVTIEILQGDESKGEAISHYTSETAGDPATPVSFIAEVSEDDPDISNPTGGMTTDVTSETAYIMNKELGILPATGGWGILFYVFAGAALMTLAIFMVRRGRKGADTATGMAG